MSHEPGHLFPAAPQRGLESTEHRRRIAQVVNAVLDGDTNNVLHVTLEAGVTQTQVIEPRVKTGTVVHLTPESASAAAAVASTYALATTGVITIFHAADASTDRTFGVSFHGAGAAE